MHTLSRLVPFSVTVASLATIASALTYRVNNNCPTAIELFIGATPQGSLARGATLTRSGPEYGTNAGFFYTTTNGGRANYELLAARAGFFFEVSIDSNCIIDWCSVQLDLQQPQYWYYYIVRDQNSGFFNTGIKITPSLPEVSMM